MNKTNHPSLPVPNKSKLENLYSVEIKSTWEIAKIYNVSQSQIRRWFKYLGIKTRTRSEAPSGRPPTGKKNWNWIGNKVSYQALHAWVRRHKGTPKKCEHCRSTEKKKYEWANVSKKYRRELSDWVRLCTKCHSIFDRN